MFVLFQVHRQEVFSTFYFSFYPFSVNVLSNHQKMIIVIVLCNLLDVQKLTCPKFHFSK